MKKDTIMTYPMIKKSFVGVFAFAVLALVALPAGSASAQTYYYPPTTGYQYQPQTVTPSVYSYGGTQMTEAQLIAFLQQLIVQLQAQIAAKKGHSYNYGYGTGYYGYTPGYNYVISDPRSGSGRYDDEEPDVETESARSINDDSARLRGSVDMNDFEDGEVFFVYGTDEDRIKDVERDFDSYRDVETRGERLQKVRVDSSLDGDEDYDYRVTGLDEDTRYYFTICVGYEDEDDDDVLACGDVLRFTTDD